MNDIDVVFPLMNKDDLHHYQAHHKYHHASYDGNNNTKMTYERQVLVYWGAVGPAVSNITFLLNAKDSQLSTIANENTIYEAGDVMVNVPTWQWKDINANVGNTSTIDFLKIDCEGCEFDFIPTLGTDTFADKEKIRYVGLELHLSLMDPNEATLALKPSEEKKQATLEAMNKRGCPTNLWEVTC